MNPVEKARRLRALHVKGSPLRLFNVWDAGSAKAVTEAGAAALATSSWAVAASQGRADGQDLPLEIVLATARSIVGASELPVSIDIEGGYGETPDEVGATMGKVAALGVAGVNIEDRIIGGQGLYAPDVHAARLRGARKASEVPVFINARSDVFFQGKPADDALLTEALARASAYAEAGADGLFVPGLVDERLIGALCERSPLPVNVMMSDNIPPLDRLAALGVARVSYGPIPYLKAMAALRDAAKDALL